MDEVESGISMPTFPQYVLHGNQCFLLVVFVEKTYGKYVMGIGVGHFFGEKDTDQTEMAALLGFKSNDNLDLMVEYFYIRNHFGKHDSKGFVNAGFHQKLSDNFVLLTPFGTQLFAPSDLKSFSIGG